MDNKKEDRAIVSELAIDHEKNNKFAEEEKFDESLYDPKSINNFNPKNHINREFIFNKEGIFPMCIKINNVLLEILKPMHIVLVLNEI